MVGLLDVAKINGSIVPINVSVAHEGSSFLLSFRFPYFESELLFDPDIGGRRSDVFFHSFILSFAVSLDENLIVACSQSYLEVTTIPGNVEEVVTMF